MTTLTDYQRWRDTPGGRVHSLSYPVSAEAVAEAQATVNVAAVRDFQDRHEFLYSRRPTLAEARAALDRGWQRGQGWTGSAAELQTATQAMFPGAFVVRNLGDQVDDKIRTGRDVVGLQG